MTETQKVPQSQKTTTTPRPEVTPVAPTAETTPQLTSTWGHLSRGTTNPRQLLHLQRTINNQATLRLMRRSQPQFSLTPHQPKKYLKRKFIQRNIMPYETWKDYSSGGFFSSRPTALKNVDAMLQMYHERKSIVPLWQIVKILDEYKQKHSEEWDKNERAKAVDALLTQARTTHQMLLSQDPTVKNANKGDLLSATEFKALTRDEGMLFGEAGLSSFQEAIITKIEAYHKLPDAIGADVNAAIALVMEMSDLADQWVDQYEGGDKLNRENRLTGFRTFQKQLVSLLKTLRGYVAGQLEEEPQQQQGNVPQGGNVPPKYKRNLKNHKLVDVDSSSQSLKDATNQEITELRKTVDAKHEGDAKSMFTKLTPIINGLAGNSGEKGEIDLEFKFPIPNASVGVFGAFVGGHFKIVVENEVDPFKKPEEQNSVKLRGDLTFTAGIDFTIGEFKAELGGYLETRGNTPEQAATLLSYAFYRRLTDSQRLAAIAAGIWGGNMGGMGKARAEKWARKVEKEMLSVSDNYAEIGMVGVLGLKANVTDKVEAGVKVQGSWGRKYNKKTQKDR